MALARECGSACEAERIGVNQSWPDRLIEVPVRIFYFYLAALAEDPPATVAVSVILLSVLAGLWLLPRTKRFVDRRLAAHQLRAEINAIGVPDTDTAGPDDAALANVYDLHPPAAPPARHDLHRTPPTRPAGRRITRLRRDRHRTRT
jgi:hypothetical protein